MQRVNIGRVMGELVENEATEEIAALRRELHILNNHRFIRAQNAPIRMLGLQFMRGLAFGLGTVMGASILVSIIGFALAQIEFLPIIGNWAAEIARPIEAAN